MKVFLRLAAYQRRLSRAYARCSPPAGTYTCATPLCAHRIATPTRAGGRRAFRAPPARLQPSRCCISRHSSLRCLITRAHSTPHALPPRGHTYLCCAICVARTRACAAPLLLFGAFCLAWRGGTRLAGADDTSTGIDLIFATAASTHSAPVAARLFLSHATLCCYLLCDAAPAPLPFLLGSARASASTSAVLVAILPQLLALLRNLLWILKKLYALAARFVPLATRTATACSSLLPCRHRVCLFRQIPRVLLTGVVRLP